MPSYILTVIIVSAAFLLLIADSNASEELARGLGDEINWITFDDGLLECKKTNKPMMLIIHKSWCGACKAFKPKFAASQDIQEMSKQFVMVNCQDDEEPKDKQFSPDGGYIPRILFLDPAGDVLTDIYNKAGNAKYKYFYSSIEPVLDSMRLALENVNSEGKLEL